MQLTGKLGTMAAVGAAALMLAVPTAMASTHPDSCWATAAARHTR